MILVPVLLAAVSAQADSWGVPRDVLHLRRELIGASRLYWGLNGPESMLAAQVAQESRGRINAKSPVGAEGPAQIMPSTRAWLLTVMPADPEAGVPSSFNPAWALRAMSYYDQRLWKRMSGATPRHRLAKALAGYNCGEGWVRKDEAEASRIGLDPQVWLYHADEANGGRKAAAKRETLEYSRRILDYWEPRCMAAGFSRGGGL